jgi:hypothetical protein
VETGWKTQSEGGVLDGGVVVGGRGFDGRTKISLEILSWKKVRKAEAKERLEEELGSDGGDFRDRRELRMDHRWRGLVERSLIRDR